MAQGGGSNGARLLVLLLVGALGVGGWNYHRNVSAEDAEFRPFRGYATADLDRMIAAQQAEIARIRPHAEGARARRAEARSGGLIGDQVREFERVQRAANRTRDLTGQLAELEVMLAQMQQERGKRGNEGEGAVGRILRLAFTF